MARPPDHRARGGAREQQRASDQRRHADDQDAGRAERDAQAERKRSADVAAVSLAERQHQAGGEDDEAGTERAHVDELAARDHQRAHDHAGGREYRARRADQRVETVGRQRAGEATAPAEVEDCGKEDADCRKAEPDQLRVLVAAMLGRALALAHA